MQLGELNRLLDAFKELKLGKFDLNQLSRTSLPDGSDLYVSALPNSLMLYLEVDKLGQDPQKQQELYELLLRTNFRAGDFANLRLCYDPKTSVVWLCYDLMYDDLTAASFETGVSAFLQHALAFRDLVRSYIQELLHPGLTEPISVPSRSVNPLSSEHDFVRPAPEAQLEMEEEPVVNVMVAQAMFMMA